nr:MAG TPA: hypothetical protein [Caudoviricetes sp.]
MLEKLQAIAERMTDGAYGDAISRAGQIGGGIGLGIGAGTGVSFADIFQYMPHTWPEWAAFFSVVCVVPMIIRTIFTSIAKGIMWLVRLKNGSTNT